MKSYSLVFLGIYLFCFACKREANPQPYSTWTIGADSFSTNQTTLVTDKAGLLLESKSADCIAKYSSIYVGFPEDGQYSLAMNASNPDPSFVLLRFLRGNTGYGPKYPDIVTITRGGGILTIDMPQTRFYNYLDATDTPIIKATIRVRE